MKTKILLINGPNLQLLGQRAPEIYGSETLAALEENLRNVAGSLHIELECFQSNHEGGIVSRIGETLADGTAGIVLNAGAYTHTSVAIRDAIEAVKVPTIEVHISNIHAREVFRHTSLIAPVCVGQITGLGFAGYELALQGLVRHIQTRKN